MSVDMAFTLNGRPTRVFVRREASLLDVLREQCGITSLKDGCAPQGQCGACLVLMDGAAKVSCAMPATRADGADILTLEGVSPEERELTARAFAAAAGVQCGFCIPGIALRAKWLLDRSPAPTRAEIARAIDVHLCRCTGYTKILDAIELLARARRGEAVPAPLDDGGVGRSLTRYQAEALTLGMRPYVADLARPGLLHGAVVLSPHARAQVRRIDTTRAAALPGVVRVATAADVPGHRWYGLLYDDWPGFVAEGEEVRCVGDVLAVVAAEDVHTAREAATLVDVEYEPLPPVLDPAAALADGSPQVNPKHANLLSRTVVRRGDADAALAQSAHLVSGTWQTQRIEHLYIEPECALAEVLPDGRVQLFSQGQGIFDDRRQVARFLDLPEEQVFVELVPNGGGFGGKEDMSIQAQTALLAWLTRRPVKLALSREESIRLHPKRHPITMQYTVGCDAEGRLTAVKARMVGDSGAYASVGGKVLERAAGHACGPYRVPHVDIEAIAVYTNNPPCGAMRGFGANQAHFAMEGCVDLLAARAAIDPWEIRWRNALEVGDTFATGQVLEKSVGIRKTLLAVKPDYDTARAAGRAVGIACGIKNSGIGNGLAEWGKARLVVEQHGTVSLYNGYTEMGQGLLTVLVQFAVEVTGLPASVFRPRVDTTYALACGQTTASRATLFGGRAVVSAAEKLRADLDAGLTLADLAGRIYAADLLVNDTTAPGAAVDLVKTHTAYGYATQVVVLDERGRVDRVIAAHDVGRVVNPALCEGQIEGSDPHGSRLRADRGTGVRERDAGDLQAEGPRRPSRARHARREGDPRRGTRAGGPLRREGRRRDRSRADRGRSRRCARGVRRRAPVHAADARFHRRPRHERGEGSPCPAVTCRTRSRASSTRTRTSTAAWRRWGCPPRARRRARSSRSSRASGGDSIVPWTRRRSVPPRGCYVAEALLAGTTVLVDHHESPSFIEGSLDVLAEACDELGMRAVLCYGATERNGGPDEAGGASRNAAASFDSNQRGLVRGVVGLHASFTVSDDTIRAAGRLCRDLGTVLHVHLAEDSSDVEDARRRGYPGPLERLLDLDALPPGSILAHGVHLSADQVRRAMDAGCWIVQNPRSNRHNRVGLPRCAGRGGRRSPLAPMAIARTCWTSAPRCSRQGWRPATTGRSSTRGASAASGWQPACGTAPSLALAPRRTSAPGCRRGATPAGGPSRWTGGRSSRRANCSARTSTRSERTPGAKRRACGTELPHESTS